MQFFDGLKQWFVNHNQPFSLTFVGNGGYHQLEILIIRPRTLDQTPEHFLNLEVRNHLSGDLGEPTGSVGDRDKPLGIELGNISGRVPAILQHNLSLLGAIEVADHDVGPLDLEQPRLIETKDRSRVLIDNANNRPGNRAPDSPFLGSDLRHHRRSMIWHIDRRDRRGFGGSIPFNGTQAESFFKGGGQFNGHLLGPNHDNLKRGQLLTLTALDVCSQECGGRHHDGAPILLAQVPDDLRVEWVEVVDSSRLEGQWHPQRGHVPKRVKERQDSDYKVGFLDLDQLPNGVNIRADVMLAQHHALGITGRSRGENHRDEVIRLNPVEPQPPVQQPGRCGEGLQTRHKFVAKADLTPQVFDKHDLDGRRQFEFELGQELPIGQNMPDPRLLEARLDNLARGGVVQVHDHPRHQREGGIGQRSTHRRG